MSDEQQTPSRGLNFWIVAGLALSLAANAYFIGTYVGARAYHHRWFENVDGPPMGGDFRPGPDMLAVNQFDLRELVMMLPESAQDDAIATLESHRDDVRDLFIASAQARMMSLSAMQAEAFDADALEDAFARSRAADQALFEAVHGSIVEIVADLTPEERAAMLARLEERVPDRWHDMPHRGLERFHDRPPFGERREEFHERRDERREDRREEFRERLEDRQDSED